MGRLGEHSYPEVFMVFPGERESSLDSVGLGREFEKGRELRLADRRTQDRTRWHGVRTSRSRTRALGIRGRVF
jgi:hypothetical protein